MSFYSYPISLQAQVLKMKFKKNPVPLEENSDILPITSWIEKFKLFFLHNFLSSEYAEYAQATFAGQRVKNERIF